MSRKHILFVTGTDTGVGKTVFTAMLLHHLRQRGRNVLAMKPFCSGSLEDVDLLREFQDQALSREEINPYYYSEPVAPAAAKSEQSTEVKKEEVLEKIERLAARCDFLLVEGCGGLMVPLSGSLLLVDLIAALQCRVVLVAPNKLGVMNHTLLSVEALQQRGLNDLSVVLMEQKVPDISAASNAAVLAKWLAPHRISRIPYLEGNLNDAPVLRRHGKAFGDWIVEMQF